MYIYIYIYIYILFMYLYNLFIVVYCSCFSILYVAVDFSLPTSVDVEVFDNHVVPLRLTASTGKCEGSLWILSHTATSTSVVLIACTSRKKLRSAKLPGSITTCCPSGQGSRAVFSFLSHSGCNEQAPKPPHVLSSNDRHIPP